MWVEEKSKRENSKTSNFRLTIFSKFGLQSYAHACNRPCMHFTRCSYN
jgi:hypothetical protein